MSCPRCAELEKQLLEATMRHKTSLEKLLAMTERAIGAEERADELEDEISALNPENPANYAKLEGNF